MALPLLDLGPWKGLSPSPNPFGNRFCRTSLTSWPARSTEGKGAMLCDTGAKPSLCGHCPVSGRGCRSGGSSGPPHSCSCRYRDGLQPHLAPILLACLQPSWGPGEPSAPNQPLLPGDPASTASSEGSHWDGSDPPTHGGPWTPAAALGSPGVRQGTSRRGGSTVIMTRACPRERTNTVFLSLWQARPPPARTHPISTWPHAAGTETKCP